MNISKSKETNTNTTRSPPSFIWQLTLLAVIFVLLVIGQQHFLQRTIQQSNDFFSTTSSNISSSVEDDDNVDHDGHVDDDDDDIYNEVVDELADELADDDDKSGDDDNEVADTSVTDAVVSDVGNENQHAVDAMSTIEEYRKGRSENFYSWYEGNKTNQLKPNIDTEGPILDFAIAGFAKCGTTSMEANLGYLAPMPIADVCTPISNTVYYAYKNWPKQFDNDTCPTKILRGTKCPRGVNSRLKGTYWMDELSTYLPKTLIIVGVRHPVAFFQSFWNMLTDNRPSKRDSSPYDSMIHCLDKQKRHCYEDECPNGQILCFHRSRLHLPLARVGKTALDEQERELLAPNDPDGGMKLTNHQIKNPIFIYELSEIGQDYMWDAIAKLLQVPYIRHDIHKGNNENRKKDRHQYRLNFCDAEYDDFRAAIMPHAYNMSSWFCDYLVPAAKDENTNVYMADPDRFCEIVRSYVEDPCDRLRRYENGTYALRDDFNNITAHN